MLTIGNGSLQARLVLIAILGALLILPLLAVWGMVTERQGRIDEVARDIARDWGGEQKISGPYLVLPYAQRSSSDTPAGERKATGNAVISLDSLTIAAEAETVIRRRSIFGVPGYRGRVTFAGRIDAVDLRPLQINPDDILWNEASLVVLVDDPGGIVEQVILKIEGKEATTFRPGPGPTIARRGIHVPMSGFNSQTALAFTFEMQVKGTNGLWFAPAARDTAVRISADWPHPSFAGAFLPDERTEPGSGFTARWRIPDLARTIGMSWRVPVGSDLYPAGNEAQFFGVRFYQQGTLYQLIERSLKYGVILIGAIFLAVLLMEIHSGRALHPVQYVLVGIAQVMFFALLLSLAEQIDFQAAYLIASTATVALISVYAALTTRSIGFGLVLAGVLSVLLFLLRVLLSVEDYSLVVGVVVAFVALAAFMLSTTRIDWSRPQGGSRRSSDTERLHPEAVEH